jgi:hypothetical protein
MGCRPRYGWTGSTRSERSAWRVVRQRAGARGCNRAKVRVLCCLAGRMAATPDHFLCCLFACLCQAQLGTQRLLLCSPVGHLQLLHHCRMASFGCHRFGGHLLCSSQPFALQSRGMSHASGILRRSLPFLGVGADEGQSKDTGARWE